MKQNIKGTTLIEVLVAIVVLSIACLMSATGISTIISHMSEGAEIKKGTNTIVSAIDGDPTKNEYIDILSTRVGVTNIQLEDGTKLIATGTMFQGEVKYGTGVNDIVSLSRYSAKEMVMTENEKNAYSMFVRINNPRLTIDWYNALSDEDKNKIEIETGLKDPTKGGSWSDQFVDKNERFMQYVALTYYYKMDATGKREAAWPELKTSAMYLIDPNKPGEKIYLNTSNTFYMLPYFSNGGGKPTTATYGVNMIYARSSAIGSLDGNWNTAFVFNDLDNHWYVHVKSTKQPLSLSNITINSTLNASSKAEAEQKLTDFKQALLEQKDGWYRIYED